MPEDTTPHTDKKAGTDDHEQTSGYDRLDGGAEDVKPTHRRAIEHRDGHDFLVVIESGPFLHDGAMWYGLRLDPESPLAANRHHDLYYAKASTVEEAAQPSEPAAEPKSSEEDSIADAVTAEDPENSSHPQGDASESESAGVDGETGEAAEQSVPAYMAEHTAYIADIESAGHTILAQEMRNLAQRLGPSLERQHERLLEQTMASSRAQWEQAYHAASALESAGNTAAAAQVRDSAASAYRETLAKRSQAVDEVVKHELTRAAREVYQSLAQLTALTNNTLQLISRPGESGVNHYDARLARDEANVDQAREGIVRALQRQDTPFFIKETSGPNGDLVLEYFYTCDIDPAGRTLYIERRDERSGDILSISTTVTKQSAQTERRAAGHGGRKVLQPSDEVSVLMATIRSDHTSVDRGDRFVIPTDGSALTPDQVTIKLLRLDGKTQQQASELAGQIPLQHANLARAARDGLRGHRSPDQEPAVLRPDAVFNPEPNEEPPVSGSGSDVIPPGIFDAEAVEAEPKVIVRQRAVWNSGGRRARRIEGEVVGDPVEDRDGRLFYDFETNNRRVKVPVDQIELQPSAQGNETRTISDERATELLSYTDVLTGDDREDALAFARTNENAIKYRETLKQVVSEEGEEEVLDLARELRQQLLDDMQRLGLEPSEHGRSISWAVWDLAKQRYYSEHPDETTAEYQVADPFGAGGEAIAKQNEIIARQLGWEFESQFIADPSAIGLAAPSVRTDVDQILRNGRKNNIGRLSASELARLGRLLLQETTS